MTAELDLRAVEAGAQRLVDRWLVEVAEMVADRRRPWSEIAAELHRVGEWIERHDRALTERHSTLEAAA